jgi:serine/threonine protein kinase
MYRWCSKCNEKRRNGDTICPVCQYNTDIELDISDTLRIDGKREFIITKQLSHFTDAGMSAVYLAERKDKPNMYGAIKIAKPSKVEALHREAEVLQRLKHDHIIRLVHPERALWQDRKDNTSLHFFALEYMDGGSLKDLLSQKQKLPLDEAVPIILAVGQALAYAHQNRYVHLDVKPANILFGKDGRIVLSDFGIARAETQAGELKKRIGTLFYNSPEQLETPPSHTHKADIYALGIILYEMLVGADRFRQHRSSSSSKEDSHPSSGSKPLAQNIRQFNPLPPPRKLEPRIPRPVERVILKAIAPNPAARYASVQAMLDDLMKAVSGTPPQKKLLFLLAGVGLFLAIALIVLGISFIPLEGLGLAASTTTSTPTSTSPAIAETPPAEPTTPANSIQVSINTPTPSSTPPPPPTDTPTAGPTPTVTRLPATETPTRAATRPVTPQPVRPEGTLELIEPENGQPLADDRVVFRWVWRDKGCSQPPVGYGFEIRIWPDKDLDRPPGAMSAEAGLAETQCDPNTGIRSFTIGNVKEAPGFEGAREGRFRWDVALVELAPPYRPIVTTQYRTFFTN